MPDGQTEAAHETSGATSPGPAALGGAETGAAQAQEGSQTESGNADSSGSQRSGGYASNDRQKQLRHREEQVDADHSIKKRRE